MPQDILPILETVSLWGMILGFAITLGAIAGMAVIHIPPKAERRAIRLLKRYVRWKASVAKAPGGGTVEYRWVGLSDGHRLWVDEYRRYPGKREFRRRRCLEYRVKTDFPDGYGEYLSRVVFPETKTSSPEELDLFLSSCGF